MVKQLWVCVIYRSEHLNALGEIPQECHDGHLLHETLDLAELDHEAILICQVLQRSAFLLVLTQNFQLRFRWNEPHQTLHEIHRQRPQVKPYTHTHTHIKALSSSIGLPPEAAVRSPPYHFIVNHDKE